MISSTAMDPEVSTRLGEVISELSGITQVLVATPDPNLLAALERSTRQKSIVHLKGRDPGSGCPCVQLGGVGV